MSIGMTSNIFEILVSACNALCVSYLIDNSKKVIVRLRCTEVLGEANKHS